MANLTPVSSLDNVRAIDENDFVEDSVINQSLQGLLNRTEFLNTERARLASTASPSDGAGMVAFKQSGAGAVVRSLYSKALESVSVKDFGAVGDGVTDDTAAIQAAITAVGIAGGGMVLFPAGTYKVSSSLNVSNQSVRLCGASRYSTLIKQATLTAKILNITGNFFCLDEISFIYDGTPASGATAIYCSGSYCTISDFVVRNAHTAIEWHQGVAGKIRDFELLDYEAIGLYAHDLNDLFVSRFIINAGNATRGALGGIRLVDKVEAFVCTEGDVLLGQYSMTMDAAAFAIGTRPAYNNFTDVFFDSATNATQIVKCVETDFVSCWFSGGRSGAGAAGAVLDNCQSIRLTNSRFFNCGAAGVVVNSSSASDITFTACKADSNSVTTGPGVSHGFQFASGCNQFQLIGCTSTNGLYTGTQAYGVFIGTGCTQFVVRDCNLVGNATGALLDGSSTSADKTIHGNIGYRTSNRGTAVISSGTTSVVVSHGLQFAPEHSDIVLTRGSTNASSVDLYVDSATITATQFTIRTAPAPSVNVTIIWHVRSNGS
jgi:hypothetical protein